MQLAQINMQHSRAAAATLTQFVKNDRVDVVLIQEPWLTSGKVGGFEAAGKIWSVAVTKNPHQERAHRYIPTTLYSHSSHWELLWILKYYECLSQKIEKYQGRCIFSVLCSLMWLHCKQSAIIFLILNAMSFHKFCRFTLFDKFPEACAKEDASLSNLLRTSSKSVRPLRFYKLYIKSLLKNLGSISSA